MLSLEKFNIDLFLFLNAGPHLHGLPLWTAIFIAKYVIFIVAVGMMAQWLWGDSSARLRLLSILLAILLALTINKIISLIGYLPRPFVLGIGHTYLSHAATSTFPSNHATILGVISLVYLGQDKRNWLKILLVFVTLSVAWARIYVGVHFPLDMVAGLLVAAFSVALVGLKGEKIAQYFLPYLENLYRRLFQPVINQGWIMP